MDNKYNCRALVKSIWNRENGMSVLHFVFTALFLNMLIEMLSRRSIAETLDFIFHEPLLYLLGALIILFTLSFSLLSRKRGFWFMFIVLVWFAFGITDFVQRSFRSMPLTASDIFLMSSVKDIFELYLSYFQLVLIMLGISIGLGILVFLWYLTRKRKSVFLFGVSSVLFSGSVLFLSIFLMLQSGRLDATSQFHSLPRAYRNNGFVYCFSASLLTRGVDEPEDYSSHEIYEILEDAEDMLPETIPDPPNIVLVQLESFFDPKYMKDFEFEYDPVPNFTKLKETCPTGLLSVPAIGAGTANTEFEVLTGMNLSHFGVGEYPYMTIVDSASSESVCHALKRIGYSTHAIHNNNATFYDRHIVYDNFGFDSFTSLEFMDNIEYNPRGWCDDSVLTGEILKCLRSSESKDFVFTVAVQPHGKYPKEAIDGAPIIHVDGIEEEGRKNGFEYYLYQLYECDQFIAELLTTLSAFEEPVVVVFYGDHLPSFNIGDSELSVGNGQTTEYVIWSNRGIDKSELDLQTYQLSAYLMERCGIFEGEVFRLHQSYSYADDLDLAYQEDLQLLEYDIMAGEHYYEADELLESPMRYDIEDITINSVFYNEEEDCVYIYGQNFTDFSVVIINGTAFDTDRISSELLTVSGLQPKNGDEIYVAQLSASADQEILCYCDTYTFRNIEKST